jgi:hypothetical protein
MVKKVEKQRTGNAAILAARQAAAGNPYCRAVENVYATARNCDLVHWVDRDQRLANAGAGGG